MKIETWKRLLRGQKDTPKKYYLFQQKVMNYIKETSWVKNVKEFRTTYSKKDVEDWAAF